MDISHSSFLRQYPKRTMTTSHTTYKYIVDLKPLLYIDFLKILQMLASHYILGVPKQTIHCLISYNVKSIKAISIK